MKKLQKNKRKKWVTAEDIVCQGPAFSTAKKCREIVLTAGL